MPPDEAPRRMVTETSGSSDETRTGEYRQCTFVRGYRIRVRYRLWPKVIKAAAGPDDPPPGYDEDPEAEAVPIDGIRSVLTRLFPGLRPQYD
jgi:hypothetical protein